MNSYKKIKKVQNKRKKVHHHKVMKKKTSKHSNEGFRILISNIIIIIAT